MAISQIATWLTLLVISSYMMEIKGMDDSSIKEIIKKKTTSCINAFNDGDFEGYFSVFDENVEIINDWNKVTKGREGVHAVYSEVKKVGKNLSIDDFKIKVMKGYAIVTDHYDIIPGNGKLTGAGRAMVIWEQIDDDWCITKMMLNTHPLDN